MAEGGLVGLVEMVGVAMAGVEVVAGEEMGEGAEAWVVVVREEVVGGGGGERRGGGGGWGGWGGLGWVVGDGGEGWGGGRLWRWQVDEQPSPSKLLPSSHCSGYGLLAVASITPSPHLQHAGSFLS